MGSERPESAHEKRQQARVPREAVTAMACYSVLAATWYQFALKPHLNAALYTFWNGYFIDLSKGLPSVPGQVGDRLHHLLAGASRLAPSRR